ncbi:Hypothetical Protein RradSPS_1722 [Rubrobacter radiotolerans]|uniref:DUF4832 domain-containing protein n=1 Tax=Rubrobacter radiotolerans TaxID=42256 RepID=A0A023X4T4_RUBRA|nr:DUF4832 domain-containing protein [Rubrobacter radiotolerans]AHY47005.1 Hypothetical Protein RradSPS_1722 [Rubrobacter radiotolerans]MDX5894411.1 DUF4832 domain-containing protein [Rubrobacter radiotolerans]SMC05943.1 protein of unknown function [Rubrobacter radiotolerans DSM 5868]
MKPPTNNLLESSIPRSTFLKNAVKCLAAGTVAATVPAGLLTGGREAKAATSTRISATYKSNAGRFANPERGWFFSIEPIYRSYYSGGRLVVPGNTTMPHEPPPGFEAFALTKARLAEHRAEGVSLIRKYYLLADFKTRPISEAYLDEHVRYDMQLMRESGMKLIPRFVYNWNVEDYDPSDTTVEWTLAHLDQLAPILRDNYDVISHMEAGFVGLYGEWHGSRNENEGSGPGNPEGRWRDPETGGTYSHRVLNDNSRRIINYLLDALPKERMIALRYVNQLKQLYAETFGQGLEERSAFSGSDQSRIGMHDDSFQYNITHRGGYWPPSTTFGTTVYNSERSFQQQAARYTVMSGEPSGDDGSGYVFRVDPIAELKRMSWNSMNNYWYEARRDGVYDSWRERGLYDQIGSRLGYRLSLTRASVPRRIAAGNSLDLTFDIKNSGFSTFYNARKVQVVLRNASTGREFRLAVPKADPRRWWAGNTHRVTVGTRIPTSVPRGDYQLFLNLPDPAARLARRPEYSVRLANEGLWEARTGYNRLNLKIRVTR